MDGRGRAFDNIFVERLWRSVKHEDVYLKGYATMGELLIGLTQYFTFYNGERPHQALQNRTHRRGALLHKSVGKSFLESMTCDASVLKPSPKHAEIDVASFVSY